MSLFWVEGLEKKKKKKQKYNRGVQTLSMYYLFNSLLLLSDVLGCSAANHADACRAAWEAAEKRAPFAKVTAQGH